MTKNCKHLKLDFHKKEKKENHNITKNYFHEIFLSLEQFRIFFAKILCFKTMLCRFHKKISLERNLYIFSIRIFRHTPKKRKKSSNVI